MVKGRFNGKSSYLRNLYSHRSIFKSLVINELIGKYRNTAIGFSWHFLMPAILLLLYYVMFTGLRSNDYENFWIYLAAGIFPFSFMNGNLTNGTTTITSSANLIKKMYFPREIIPLSRVFSSFIISLFGLLIVIIATIVSGHLEGISTLLLPAILVLMFFFVLGYVLILSAINVFFRDIQYFFASISMLFFFITPMYYLPEETTGLLSTIIWINPFTYFVNSIQQILYYNMIPSISNIIMCAILSATLLLLGTIVFNLLKNKFAERL